MDTTSGGQTLATVIPTTPTMLSGEQANTPDLSIVASWDKLASTALVSVTFKVGLGYIVSLKPHSQKIKTTERNVLVPDKPGAPAGPRGLMALDLP